MRPRRLEEAHRLALEQLAASRARVEAWRWERAMAAGMTPYRRLVPAELRHEHAALRAQILDGPSYATWPHLACALRELGVRSPDRKHLGGF